jgi:hypothetical protein
MEAFSKHSPFIPPSPTSTYTRPRAPPSIVVAFAERTLISPLRPLPPLHLVPIDRRHLCKVLWSDDPPRAGAENDTVSRAVKFDAIPHGSSHVNVY